MEVYQLILLGLAVAAVLAALAWFGPRMSQWRTHDGRPTDEAKPGESLTGTTPITEGEEALRGSDDGAEPAAPDRHPTSPRDRPEG